MKFVPYSDIDNSYRSKTINMIREQGLSGGLWQCTCKIHGANFSIYYDGITHQYAKRSSFCDGTFFGCDDVIKPMLPKVKNVYDELIKRFYPTLEYIVICGEIFGNGVNKGIFYSNTKHFWCFDIKVKTSGCDSAIYIPCDMCVDVCCNAKFPHVPVLFTGTFDDALSFPNTFNSLVPAILGEQAPANNLAEGVVIKPVMPCRFFSGERVILKNKIDKFMERASSPKVKVEVNLTEEQTALLQTMLSYVTENRLNNVVSKHGKVEQNQFGVILGMFNKDAYTDFLKDNEAKWLELDTGIQKVLGKELNKYAASFLRERFLNLMDGV